MCIIKFFKFRFQSWGSWSELNIAALAPHTDSDTATLLADNDQWLISTIPIRTKFPAKE